MNDPKLPLAFGNFGTHFKKNDRLFRGWIYQPQVFGRALSNAEVVAAQGRSGCAPTCTSATCGSDGCGGSCGACTGAKSCAESGGFRSCQMPKTLTVDGFYDDEGAYKLRFSPPHAGRWSYKTKSNAPALDGNSGSFTAAAAAAGGGGSGHNHGPVESARFAFVHADGSPYFSAGSTSYQWTSKEFAMQEATLNTLKNGQGDGPVFNKQRMTVFPKWYQFNHANPVQAGTAYQVKAGARLCLCGQLSTCHVSPQQCSSD